MAKLPKNLSKHIPSRATGSIPKGDYVGTICWSSPKFVEAKNNPKNKYAHLKLKISQGKHKGHLIDERLNFINDNPDAVQRAKDTAYSINHACKIDGDPAETSEWHDIEMRISVTVEEGQNGYPDTNRISSYMPLSDADDSGIEDPDTGFEPEEEPEEEEEAPEEEEGDENEGWEEEEEEEDPEEEEEEEEEEEPAPKKKKIEKKKVAKKKIAKKKVAKKKKAAKDDLPDWADD